MPRFAGDQYRALAFLKGRRDGHTEAMTVAHGFPLASLKDLIRAGLVTAKTESAGRKTPIRIVMFRHKIAHIAYPYLVFKTADKLIVPRPHRRVVWTVDIYARSKAIRLIDYPTPRTLLRTKTPWPVCYTSRIFVSLTALRTDIISSIYGPSGYLTHLRSDPVARQRFARCMNVYAPP
jgi:hypothetical protein